MTLQNLHIRKSDFSGKQLSKNKILFQLQKQKERGAIDIDIDRFTNEQMERMIFDKSYNPLKNETKAITGGEGGANTGEDGSGAPPGGYESEEDPEEGARKKAILRARFAAKS